MSRWFRVYDDLVDDPKVQRLSAETFRSEFMAGIVGRTSKFDRFIRPGRDRPSGPAWASLRAVVFERDDYTCVYCGERGGKLECDHVVPVVKGGESVLENLNTACRSCNRAKAAKSLEEWRQ